MHAWAAFLAQTPPTLQRLIASSQRISLPRRCSPEERLARLRAAICRAAAVRSVYFWLEPDEQQAVQILRAIPRGLNAADLAARFGPIRPLSELRADRAPRSISERLLLLGWLLPRPATPKHPTRYLLPPELRAWLPVPLTPMQNAECRMQNAAQGVPEHAPALRAATALLVCAATTPLPLRRDGRLTAAALRELTPRLAPLPPDDVAALYDWLWPLLGDLGLLAPHGAAVVVAPAARRFLAAPPAERLELLTDAWQRAPRADRWLTTLRVNLHGLDWPAFRRRLCAWAAVAPPDLLTAPADGYDRLAAALGPLGDTMTHGLTFLRRRLPWAQRNAAKVWAAACAGPLCWLGKLPQCCWDEGRRTKDEGRRTKDESRKPEAERSLLNDAPAVIGGRWSVVSVAAPSGAAPELIHVPPLTGEADLLTLAPFAAAVRSAAAGDVYTLTRASVASAVARGHDAGRLRAVLLQQCGAIPADLDAILTPNGGLRMTAQTVLLSDQPADLDAALRRRSVRRAISDQLAPGVALVAPGGEAALARALARDGRVVAPPPPVETPPVSELTPGEMAALLVAAAHYQANAPADAPPGPGDALLARLRAGLPPALQAATDATIATLREAADERQKTKDERRKLKDEACARTDLSQKGTGGSRAAPTAPEQHIQFHFDGITPSAPASARPQQPMIPTPGSADAGHQALPGGWQAEDDDWAVSGRPSCPEPVEGSVVDDNSPVATTAPCPSLADLRDHLEAAMRRRNAVTLTYQGADEPAPRERIVRPLRLERHGPWWYLYAYCLHARAERCFRLDRVHELANAAAEKPQTYHWRSARPADQPAPALSRPTKRSRIVRTGFFPDPPDPAPGHPLVGVWLE